jgi:hypothetical protein
MICATPSHNPVTGLPTYNNDGSLAIFNLGCLRARIAQIKARELQSDGNPLSPHGEAQDSSNSYSLVVQLASQELEPIEESPSTPEDPSPQLSPYLDPSVPDHIPPPKDEMMDVDLSYESPSEIVIWTREKIEANNPNPIQSSPGAPMVD